MPRKQVDARPPRPVIIARVSTDEQADEGFSLAEQVRRARDYCREMFGADVPDSDIVIEDGVSGRPGQWAKRLKLRAALDACVAGQYTHMVVYKLDRLGRNVGLMSQALEELTKSGCYFVSVMDRVDASTAAGRLYITIFLAIAQWFSDNLSEMVVVGKEGRKRAGLYNGHLAFGAMAESDGIPVRDTESITLRDGTTSARYEGLQRIFTMAADGMTMADITRAVNRLGYTTHSHKGERIFATSTIRRILNNRFYLGEIPIDKRHKVKNPGWMPGLHEPLIAQDLWDRAHAQLARRTGHPQAGRKGYQAHPFGRGMVQCVSCAEHGVVAYFHIKPAQRQGHYSSLICSERAMRHQCSEPTVRERDLEAQIETFLARFSIPAEDREALLSRYATMPPETPQNDAEGERERIRQAMDALDAKLDVGRIDATVYRQKMRALQSELAQIQDAPAAAPEVDVLRETAAYLADVVSLWRDADGWERAELVQLLFSRVWVHDRQIVRLEPAPAFASWFQIVDGEGEGAE